jgi:hypothetical protein
MGDENKMKKITIYGLAGAGAGVVISFIPDDFFIFLFNNVELFLGIAATIYAVYEKYLNWHISKKKAAFSKKKAYDLKSYKNDHTSDHTLNDSNLEDGVSPKM